MLIFWQTIIIDLCSRFKRANSIGSEQQKIESENETIWKSENNVEYF